MCFPATASVGVPIAESRRLPTTTPPECPPTTTTTGCLPTHHHARVSPNRRKARIPMPLPGTSARFPQPAPAPVTDGPPVAAPLGFRSDDAGVPR
ncbi:hypothetical protein GCM10010228_67290 [Streptomyces massasporeus]|nr:hypothetical protein GCM10010228_67290 [Streptomyces massasporeus]